MKLTASINPADYQPYLDMLRSYVDALAYASPEASVALLAAIAWIIMVLMMLYKFLK